MVGGNGGSEVVESALEELLGFGVGVGDGAERSDDAGGAVDGVSLTGGVLVAEPEGMPGAVGVLVVGEVTQDAGDGLLG